MTEKDLKKGTTTLGLVCTDGIVMATEMRATMGNLIGHKTTQKLFKISDNMALTVAGLVGDAQMLARWLSAEVKLYELKTGTTMSLRAASTLMANIMNGRRYMPFWVQLLLGGIDSEGGHVYSLDAAGGSIPDKFQTTGSGSPFVYGVLEDRFIEDLSVEQGKVLGVRALTAAMKRDSASGDGISMCVIDSNGYHRVSPEDIAKIQTKLAA
ncbi:MAG: archaeal proteasome endopeptidase complex subunit beta [Candidatus Poseidoniia archaeon]|uniref:proteasome endopeptidase complex n=1 Tax=marine metagenome TaxID=408172 RepID=A0A381WCZ4_9ZZZZ|nr:archaeal proteasome endopeptidase complex subunit beta [Candidatus Poseidoniia archaeon]MDP6441801.1 archaeal proteasome endopeptidase complex subunit beta [Candidatus Poseidoniia archaeon]MDP6592264.1 archaeal proteasome endopeptidase complex subunit beta [Candidatus Poseidoniia archaeon]MDP7096590.1 archaeal proteasome endopeptidase complex subunit beta [Candidatus Poseidoniia archaeon]MDP7187947.1 archaeal proteasome endopeptidase complex subunit beta [Candidatus Poseidoniia archaeon]